MSNRKDLYRKDLYRKDLYVKKDQTEYYLHYQLIFHKASERGEIDRYGIVVEQYYPAEKAGSGFDRVGDRLKGYPAGKDSEKGDCRIRRAEITGLSEDLKEAEAFFETVAQGGVTPDSLYEIYDDWMCAFHPRWQQKYSSGTATGISPGNGNKNIRPGRQQEYSPGRQ